MVSPKIVYIEGVLGQSIYMEGLNQLGSNGVTNVQIYFFQKENAELKQTPKMGETRLSFEGEA